MENKINLFKLLSTNSRYLIFTALIEQELCICEIEELVGLTQSNASKQMNIFKQLNIVTQRTSGPHKFYKINNQFIIENKKLIDYIKDTDDK